MLHRSEPADGSWIEQAPQKIELHFTRSIRAQDASAVLVTPSGDEQALSTAEMPDSIGRAVAFKLGSLPDGEHRVVWKVTAQDGHTVAGSLVFTTGAHPAAVGTASGQPARVGWQAVWVRWFHYGALLVMIGVIMFHAWILPRASMGRGSERAGGIIGQRARRLGVFAVGSLVLANPSRLWVHISPDLAVGSSLAEALQHHVLGTLWGRVWVFEWAVAGSFLWVLQQWKRSGSVGHGMAFATGVALALVPALSGHAAFAGQFRALAVLSSALHVLGAGFWLGTLLTIVWAGAPRSAGATAVPLAGLLKAFSPMALFAVGLVVVSGSINALLQFDLSYGFWRTTYGSAMLFKLTLVLGLLLAGAYNWKRALPGMGRAPEPQKTPWSIRLELVLAAAVLGATAFLVLTPR
jgi:copper transport protein